jgi:RNA polymerase sigma-70 factor (ECF subfamily)
MLGDIGAAEDIVQDAFTRLMAAKLGEIEDKRGWLIVVTSRLCLDQIKSARSRRERAHDASEIEFVAPPPPGLADPADRVTFDDGVRLALLVVLQQLSPAERVVFVLHDIFQMPFDTVAETVGRSAPACRQLASRARQKIAAGPGSARFDIASAEHRQVTEKFIAACSNGDLSGLLAGQPDVTVDHFGVHVGVQGSIRVLRRYDATDPVRRGPVCRLMWSATIISGL